MPLDIKKIRRWVEKECDSVSDAARRLDLKQPNLVAMLRGDPDRINPRLDTLERMADVMGVEPAELIRRAVVV